MISIDLTRGQKIQISLVAATLLIAGYFIYRGTRSAPDLTIASWVEPMRIGRDAALPISAKNPADPRKTASVTIFACYDGRLEIIEYPAASEQKASFAFEADYRRPKFNLFQDPLAAIESIGDPYKRVLSYAAYSASEHRSLGLLGRAGLTADQLKAEREHRDVMMNTITLINNGAQTGTLQPTLYNQVIAALKEYRAKPGDPTKDAAKAVLAHKVVGLAMKYISVLQDQRNAAVNKYVAAIDGVLKSEQKQKLAKVAANLKIRPRPGGGRAVRVATATVGG